MSRSTTLLLSLAVALGLAVVSNPSADHHRRELKAGIADRSPLAGALGVGAMAALVSSYHSVAVASWTTAGDRTLTVGAFGMVFLVG